MPGTGGSGYPEQRTLHWPKLCPQGRWRWSWARKDRACGTISRGHCDALARLPIGDAVESLNVSNAAAIALYAIATRQA